MRKLKINIIGLGYIGLPTAALLADRGHEVIGTDTNPKVVNAINQGKAHFFERDLDNLVRSSVSSGNLSASNLPVNADVFIICVPTPLNENNGDPGPNIDLVMDAARSIIARLKKNNLVILESTSPVGTTAQIRSLFKDKGAPVNEVHIAYCPERVLPGNIISELIQNDRIVGGVEDSATKKVASFYRTFVKGNVFETDSATAEICKLTENCYRDVNIAFANELSIICEKEGISVWEVINLANKHPRVDILQPGVGVGGHCVAVDPWFLVSKDKKNTSLIRAARRINTEKTEWVFNKIKLKAEKLYKETGQNPSIVCMGLTFKADVDDTRESPAIKIAYSIDQAGYHVLGIDPNIKEDIEIQLIDINRIPAENVLIVILVKHKQFIDIQVKNKLRKYPLLDFCNII